MNQVRSLLSVQGKLLGYSFEPGANSCALGTADLLVTIALSINKLMLALKKKTVCSAQRKSCPIARG